MKRTKRKSNGKTNRTKRNSKQKRKKVELSVVVMPREIKRYKLKNDKIVALSERLKEIYATAH